MGAWVFPSLSSTGEGEKKLCLETGLRDRKSGTDLTLCTIFIFSNPEGYDSFSVFAKTEAPLDLALEPEGIGEPTVLQSLGVSTDLLPTSRF